MDQADSSDVSEEGASKLISYFLAGLAVDKKDIWVNLSPYEKDRIIESSLAETELGKGLLSQDYILKQLSSSLSHPDTELGKSYWKNIVGEGPMPTGRQVVPSQDSLNKIWMVPQESKVSEYKNMAVITASSLDVKTETGIANVLLDDIKKDVNTGKNFAQLRQIYNSLILAQWFKQKFKNSFYNNYINKNKLNGINHLSPKLKQKIYTLYCQAFKKGVYSFTKKEIIGGRKHRRQYFSGGAGIQNLRLEVSTKNSASALSADMSGTAFKVVQATFISSALDQDKTHRRKIENFLFDPKHKSIDVRIPVPDSGNLTLFTLRAGPKTKSINSYSLTIGSLKDFVGQELTLKLFRKDGNVFVAAYDQLNNKVASRIMLSGDENKIKFRLNDLREPNRRKIEDFLLDPTKKELLLDETVLESEKLNLFRGGKANGSRLLNKYVFTIAAIKGYALKKVLVRFYRKDDQIFVTVRSSDDKHIVTKVILKNEKGNYTLHKYLQLYHKRIEDLLRKPVSEPLTVEVPALEVGKVNLFTSRAEAEHSILPETYKLQIQQLKDFSNVPLSIRFYWDGGSFFVDIYEGTKRLLTKVMDNFEGDGYKLYNPAWLKDKKKKLAKSKDFVKISVDKLQEFFDDTSLKTRRLRFSMIAPDRDGLIALILPTIRGEDGLPVKIKVSSLSNLYRGKEFNVELSKRGKLIKAIIRDSITKAVVDEKYSIGLVDGKVHFVDRLKYTRTELRKFVQQGDDGERIFRIPSEDDTQGVTLFSYVNDITNETKSVRFPEEEERAKVKSYKVIKSNGKVTLEYKVPETGIKRSYMLLRRANGVYFLRPEINVGVDSIKSFNGKLVALVNASADEGATYNELFDKLKDVKEFKGISVVDLYRRILRLSKVPPTEGQKVGLMRMKLGELFEGFAVLALSVAVNPDGELDEYIQYYVEGKSNPDDVGFVDYVTVDRVTGEKKYYEVKLGNADKEIVKQLSGRINKNRFGIEANDVEMVYLDRNEAALAGLDKLKVRAESISDYIEVGVEQDALRARMLALLKKFSALSENNTLSYDNAEYYSKLVTYFQHIFYSKEFKQEKNTDFIEEHLNNIEMILEELEQNPEETAELLLEELSKIKTPEITFDGAYNPAEGKYVPKLSLIKSIRSLEITDIDFDKKVQRIELQLPEKVTDLNPEKAREGLWKFLGKRLSHSANNEELLKALDLFEDLGKQTYTKLETFFGRIEAHEDIVALRQISRDLLCRLIELNEFSEEHFVQYFSQILNEYIDATEFDKSFLNKQEQKEQEASESKKYLDTFNDYLAGEMSTSEFKEQVVASSNIIRYNNKANRSVPNPEVAGVAGLFGGVSGFISDLESGVVVEGDAIARLVGLYRDVDVALDEGRENAFYQKELKAARKKRENVRREIVVAYSENSKKELVDLNEKSVSLNKRILKLQLMVAGRMLNDRFENIKGNARKNIALATLIGARNTAAELYHEMTFLVLRKRAGEKLKQMKTRGISGEILWTFNLGGYDISKIEKDDGTVEVVFPKRKWINVHRYLENIRLDTQRGEIEKAKASLLKISRIYKLGNRKVSKTYKQIFEKLTGFYKYLSTFEEGQLLTKDKKSELKISMQEIIKLEQNPKHWVFEEISFESIARALRSEAHTIESNIEEYKLIMGVLANLHYYLELLKMAKDSGLSKRNAEIINDGLAGVDTWVSRGFVRPKQWTASDVKGFAELIEKGSLSAVSGKIERIKKNLQERLTSLERINNSVAKRAASLHTEYRDADIKKSIEHMNELLEKGNLSEILLLIEDIKTRYFKFSPSELVYKNVLEKFNAVIDLIKQHNNSGKDLTDGFKNRLKPELRWAWHYIDKKETSSSLGIYMDDLDFMDIESDLSSSAVTVVEGKFTAQMFTDIITSESSKTQRIMFRRRVRTLTEKKDGKKKVTGWVEFNLLENNGRKRKLVMTKLSSEFVGQELECELMKRRGIIRLRLFDNNQKLLREKYLAETASNKLSLVDLSFLRRKVLKNFVLSEEKGNKRFVSPAGVEKTYTPFFVYRNIEGEKRNLALVHPFFNKRKTVFNVVKTEDKIEFEFLDESNKVIFKRRLYNDEKGDLFLLEEADYRRKIVKTFLDDITKYNITSKIMTAPNGTLTIFKRTKGKKDITLFDLSVQMLEPSTEYTFSLTRDNMDDLNEVTITLFDATGKKRSWRKSYKNMNDVYVFSKELLNRTEEDEQRENVRSEARKLIIEGKKVERTGAWFPLHHGAVVVTSYRLPGTKKGRDIKLYVPKHHINVKRGYVTVESVERSDDLGNVLGVASLWKSEQMNDEDLIEARFLVEEDGLFVKKERHNNVIPLSEKQKSTRMNLSLGRLYNAVTILILSWKYNRQGSLNEYREYFIKSKQGKNLAFIEYVTEDPNTVEKIYFRISPYLRMGNDFSRFLERINPDLFAIDPTDLVSVNLFRSKMAIDELEKKGVFSQLATSLLDSSRDDVFIFDTLLENFNKSNLNFADKDLLELLIELTWLMFNKYSGKRKEDEVIIGCLNEIEAFIDDLQKISVLRSKKGRFNEIAFMRGRFLARLNDVMRPLRDDNFMLFGAYNQENSTYVSKARLIRTGLVDYKKEEPSDNESTALYFEEPGYREFADEVKDVFSGIDGSEDFILALSVLDELKVIKAEDLQKFLVAYKDFVMSLYEPQKDVIIMSQLIRSFLLLNLNNKKILSKDDLTSDFWDNFSVELDYYVDIVDLEDADKQLREVVFKAKVLIPSAFDVVREYNMKGMPLVRYAVDLREQLEKRLVLSSSVTSGGIDMVDLAPEVEVSSTILAEVDIDWGNFSGFSFEISSIEELNSVEGFFLS